MAGAHTGVLQTAGALMGTASALQSGAGFQALAGGAAALAGQANPQLGQALQVASQAQALMAHAQAAQGLLHHASPAAATPMAEQLHIAEHSLAGQAVQDFATAEAPFIPPSIDPARTAEPEAAAARALTSFGDGGRLLRFYSPLPGAKALLLESMSGHSALSENFVYQLSLISTDAAIDLKDLMGKNVSIESRKRVAVPW